MAASAQGASNDLRNFSFLQHAYGHAAGCRISCIHLKGAARTCCLGWLAWLRVVGFFMHGCSVRMGLCIGYGV